MVRGCSGGLWIVQNSILARRIATFERTKPQLSELYIIILRKQEVREICSLYVLYSRSIFYSNSINLKNKNSDRGQFRKRFKENVAEKYIY